MVNQASLNRRVHPGVQRREESTVYAGTVVEEGELTILCQRSRLVPAKFEKIVTMIEETEKLKSGSGEQSRTSCRQTGSVYTWLVQHLTYAAHTEM